MVALQQDEATPSLIEVGARRLAAVRSRKSKGDTRTGPSVAARAARWAAEVLGTLLALVCFVVAAFVVSFVLGFCVAGVALLLLDFKVSLVRRARVAERR